MPAESNILLSSSPTFKLAEKQSHLLNTIKKISEILQDISYPQSALASVLQDIQELFNFNQSTIALYNEHTSSPEIIFPANIQALKEKNNFKEARLHLRVFEFCQTSAATSTQSPDLNPEEGIENHKFYTIFPIRSNNKCFGTIGLEKKTATSLTLEESDFLQIVILQIGMALAQYNTRAQAEHADTRYQQFFQQTNIPLFLCNKTGQLSDCNPAFMEMIGLCSAVQSREVNFFDRLQISEKHKETFKRLLSKCGFFQNLETKIRRMDGHILSILFTITPVRDKYNKIIGFEGILQDITEKRELEDQLIQAQKIAVLGSLAGGIAHDFNNLISGIMGCASLVNAEIEKSNPHYDDIQTILQASQKAADLTRQLLTFSRKEKNIVENLDVNQIISELIKLLSRTLGKKIKIKTDLNETIPSIQANPTRIQQALMNICINARDAMPDGGTLSIKTNHITLKKMLKTKPVIKPGYYLEIQIQDSGMGMDEKTVKKIFEPFFTTKDEKSGCGLGMAIVFEVVGSHNGGITIDSQIGQGTTFSIYFPAQSGPVPKSRKNEPLPALPKGKETLLIIDDEEIVCTIAKRMLEKFGYRVLIAHSGTEAIERYKHNASDIDLLILDMIMPDMDGKETLHEIKQINPNVKALVTSGYHEESMLNHVKAHGFNGYLQKPFMAGQLLKSVRAMLDETPNN